MANNAKNEQTTREWERYEWEGKNGRTHYKFKKNIFYLNQRRKKNTSEHSMWMLYLVYPRSNQRCRRRYKPLWLLSLLCTMIFLWMRLLVFGVLFFHRFALKYSFVVWTSVESKPCVNSVRINGMDCDGNACATHCGHVYACINTWFGWLDCLVYLNVLS